jgi:hypothetical protein
MEPDKPGCMLRVTTDRVRTTGTQPSGEKHGEGSLMFVKG